jgi:hypothetical protein
VVLRVAINSPNEARSFVSSLASTVTITFPQILDEVSKWSWIISVKKGERCRYSVREKK